MTNTDIYKPSLSLLSQMGIQLVTFHPEAEVLNYLLYRTSLESGTVTSPLSYYTAAHPGFGLLRLKSGSLVYTTFSRESSITLSGNCLLLFDCQYPYRIRIKGSAEYDILHFSGFVQIYFQQYLASRKPFWLHTPAVGTACELLPLFDGREQNPVLSHMLLTKLLSEMALENMAPERNIPSWLADLRSELETRYFHKYTLEELEQKYKINKYKICREFRDYFQSSPLQYLHGVRIRAAKDLLKETNLKIHEISYEVGYENTNHFINHFKKLTGMTPTQFRSRP